MATECMKVGLILREESITLPRRELQNVLKFRVLRYDISFDVFHV